MKKCGCPCHSVGCAVCDGCAGKHRFTASATALSPEERAERAWETESARQKLYSASQGAIFKAGYLARDKETK